MTSRVAFLAVLLIVLPWPAFGVEDGDGYLVREFVRSIFEARKVDIGQRIRIGRLLGLHAGASAASWDEYYSHRAYHFSGEVSIDTFTALVTGTIRADIRVTGKERKRLYFMVFLPVLSVKDTDGNELKFSEDTTQGMRLIRVEFDQPLADGQELSLVFTVSGIPDCSSASGPFDIEVCAFRQDVAYMAMMFFLPISAAQDYATFDLEITVPSGFTVASTGRTVEVVPVDAERERHHVVQDWRSDSHSLSIGRYDISVVPYEAKQVKLFTLKGGSAGSLAPETLLDMRNILDFYSTAYGSFLFPKMDACEITDDAGAAFGWPALLWIPPSMFFVGTGASPENQRTALLAHELAHQWFPDMLKMNDPYAAWLSEGFAEYSSVRYMGLVMGEEFATGIFDHYGLLYRYFVPPSFDYGLTSKESLYVSDPWVYQIVTYYKGAVVTNTLARVVGQANFLKAIKKLYADIAGKDAYYDTKVLKKYMENAYGDSLGWFFDEWVYGTGYPVYTVDVQSSHDKAVVRVRRASSNPKNTFRMPVTLRLVTTSGEEDHVEMIDQDEMTFTYEIQGRLVRVRFDPDRTFIKRVVPGLKGDADLSGEVDGIDLIYAVWARDSNLWSPNFIPWLDFDDNKKVDEGDLGAVMDNFGKTGDEVQP